MDYTAPELRKSALLTIDMQCDFVMPGAVCEIPGSQAIIPRMKALATAYRQAGRPIIHIVRLYLPDGSNVDPCRRAKVETGMRMVAPDSSGAELVAELKPYPTVRLDARRLLKGEIQSWTKTEWVIYKPRWGAFYQTPLHHFLVDRGVTTLVVCGCNFPNCPRTTIYEASERDYRIVVVENAVSGLYDQGKTELRHIGVSLWPTDAILDKVGSAFNL